MPRILFVCTGNVFRSLTAEFALRKTLGTSSDVIVTSAGTADVRFAVRPFVAEYLLSRGFDVSGHRRRTLIPAMLAEAGPVIAMSTEHRAILAERFNCMGVPLFTEACGLVGEPLPDVDEVVPDYETNRPAFEAHVRMIIDRIIELTPLLKNRLAS